MTEDLGKSSLNMDPKVAALLSYVLGWLTGIIFYVIEKENRFVRFHALQSIFVFGGFTVLYIALSILWSILAFAHLGFVGLLVWPVYGLLWLVSLILWIVLMIKAYQGQWFKLPVVGDMAEKKV